MAIKAHGRIVSWEGASLWVLGTKPGVRYPRTDVHSHHAVQVTLALRGQFSLVDGERLVTGPAVGVAADTEHAFEADGAVAHLFVDPDGRSGRAITRSLFAKASVAPISQNGLEELANELLAKFESPDGENAAFIACGRRLLACLAGDHTMMPQPDLRVRKMLAWTAAKLQEPMSLSDAAEHVGLSSGRARHLFVAQTGLPFRTYVLWLRVTKALEMYAAGESLTEAAHAAGFSDSAHLSRTFRRMFGISADSLRVT